jgi:hypothetical protein
MADVQIKKPLELLNVVQFGYMIMRQIELLNIAGNFRRQFVNGGYLEATGINNIIIFGGLIISMRECFLLLHLYYLYSVKSLSLIIS